MLTLFKSRPRGVPKASPAVATTNGLRDALQSFQNSLDAEQRQKLDAINATPDAQAVLLFTAQLDEENSKRQSRCVASRIMDLLQSVQQFSNVMETFVSSNPRIAALVWGSVKLVLQIASNYASYFDKLSNLFMKIGRHCPRYSEYQVLYASSTNLQKALCDFYAVVVRCCERAVTVIHRPGYVQLLRSVTASFESNFGDVLAEIDISSGEVKETINLAEAKVASSERQLQAQEREEARKYRSYGLSIHKLMQNSVSTQEAQMQLEKQRSLEHKLLDELSDYDYMTAFKNACMQRRGTTGRWPTQTKSFQEWESSTDSQMLWFTGKLGSGKTVSSGYIVQYLTTNHAQQNDKVLRFFCQHDKEVSLKWETMFRCLIRQFIDLKKQLPPDTELKLRNALRAVPINLDNLLSIFLDLLEKQDRVWLVIDGLDECPSKEINSTMKFLRELLHQKPSGLKLYIAGDERISDLIVSQSTQVHVVSTHCAEAQKDLRNVVQQLVANAIEDRELVVGSDDLSKEIEHALIAGAQGMILWVTLQLEDICAQASDEKIRQTIENLPKDLHETYNRLLSKVVRDKRGELSLKIFRWMSAAKRPFTVEEIGEATVVEPGQPRSMPERTINDLRGIVRWCHGLLTLGELDKALQFVHSSFKAFICGADTRNIVLPGFHFAGSGAADREIGEICVTYLNFSDFQTQLVKRPKKPMNLDPLAMADQTLCAGSSRPLLKKVRELAIRNSIIPATSVPVTSALILTQTSSHDASTQSTTVSHPFLDYASTFWLHHTSNISEDNSVLWNSWKELVETRHDIAKFPWEPAAMQFWVDPVKGLPLRQFIFANQHHALLKLLQSTIDEQCYEELDLLLYEAVKADCVCFVEPLLRTKKYGDRSSWLKQASRCQNHKLVEALLLSGDEWLKISSPQDRTEFLDVMVQHGSIDVVRKLIIEGFDPICLRRSSMGILEKMIRYGDTEKVDCLCNEGSAEQRDGTLYDLTTTLQTPVALAASLGKPEIMRILLEAGVDVERDVKDRTKALHLAVGYSSSLETRVGYREGRRQGDAVVIEMASILLDWGYSSAAKDEEGKVALDYANSLYLRMELEKLFERAAKKIEVVGGTAEWLANTSE